MGAGHQGGQIGLGWNIQPMVQPNPGNEASIKNATGRFQRASRLVSTWRCGEGGMPTEGMPCQLREIQAETQVVSVFFTVYSLEDSLSDRSEELLQSLLATGDYIQKGKGYTCLQGALQILVCHKV